MLVLSRKSGSAIAVGDDIEIEVLAIRGNQVKIGIRAPEAVAIVPSELKAQPSREGPHNAEGSPNPPARRMKLVAPEQS